MRACNCSSSFANTGTPSCKNLFAVARKLILVPTYDSTGARNKIAAGDTINAAYYSAAINNADTTKRWYPTPLIDNIEDVRAEPIIETLASQKKLFIQDGVRTFKGMIVMESNILIDKLSAFKCKDFSAYIIDKDRNLIGSYDGTDLYPVQVDKDTLNVLLIKTTDSTSQKIELSFDFSTDEKDEDLRMIAASEMANANPLILTGLQDINVAISGTTTEGFIAVLTTDYGTFKTPIPVTGRVITDFTLDSVTDEAEITITTVTEDPDGTYTFVIPTQTEEDVLTLTATMTGFDFPSTSITIPEAVS